MYVRLDGVDCDMLHRLTGDTDWTIGMRVQATWVAEPKGSVLDLAGLMGYHWLQTELRSVGMPLSDLDPALPPDVRIRRSIPYLRRMRNTSLAWCFYRILRDLFDFLRSEFD